MNRKLESLIDWITSKPGVEWAKPVQVVIDGKTYDGVFYCRNLRLIETVPGLHNLPTYWFALLGQPPRNYYRTIFLYDHDHPRSIFFQGIGGQWQVISYHRGTSKKERYPFGDFFVLDELHYDPDVGREKPLDRKAMEVTEMD